MGYFLVNDYQQEREFNDLEIGSVRSMVLNQGIKHKFFSRIITNNTIQYNAENNLIVKGFLGKK